MAQPTQPYKRSFSSSFSSGMGSVWGGSGKQYYILEHKSSSKYHRAGDSQEIIIDQIEIGRDPKCQVRFDESFQTVSRRHAAIVKSSNGWKLVQISTTNPTFLNGTKVERETYLQNGDEIQLAVNGPRLGFITPTGQKSTVGSIGLSRRLSLFRQQALRPYKTAVITLCVILGLVLAGAVGWGVYQNQKQQNLLVANEKIVKELDELNKKMATETGQSKEEMEAYKKQAEKLAQQIVQNNAQSAANRREMNNLQKELNTVNSQIASSSEKISSGEKKSLSDKSSGNEVATNENVSGRGVASASDINNYSQFVYAITLDKIEYVWLAGKIRNTVNTIDLPQVVGTGFLLNDGRFITARHVVEPWYYFEHFNSFDYFRFNLGTLKSYNRMANNGGEVVFHFTAISSTAKRLTFSSRTARVNRTTDRVESERSGNKTWVLRKGVTDDTDWAVFQTLEKSGFTFNNELSTNLQIGAELEVLGFPYGLGANEIQITPIYSTSNVARQGLDAKGNIIVSNDNTGRGNAGGPVLVKNNGEYQVVGIMSGSTFAKGRIVPISAAR